jgi:hypothetical protein
MKGIKVEREVKLNSQLWEQFEQAAQEQRRQPLQLLQQVLQEYLAIYQDEKLFRQMQREARRSGYREEDAVELVRQARQHKRARNGAT